MGFLATCFFIALILFLPNDDYRSSTLDDYYPD